jgi:hypothetical protein
MITAKRHLLEVNGFTHQVWEDKDFHKDSCNTLRFEEMSKKIGAITLEYTEGYERESETDEWLQMESTCGISINGAETEQLINDLDELILLGEHLSKLLINTDPA